MSVHRTFSLFLALMFLLAGCNVNHEMPKNYMLLSCQSFLVLEYTPDNPTGRVVYQIDRQNELIITSIAYQPSNKLLAIALTSKEPSKKAAMIRILNYKDLTLQTELATGKDRINGMAFNDRGEIALSVSDMNRNFPGELCLLSLENKALQTLAEGFFLNKPTWGNNSKKLYFSYRDDEQKNVAYLEIENPNKINKLAKGFSITTSDKGDLAYLDNGMIYFSQQGSHDFRPLDLPAKHTKVKFTDSIQFIKGTDDLALQQYMKSTVYNILRSSPPYTEAKIMLPNIGLLDYEIAKFD
jgi:hypothetical protein